MNEISNLFKKTTFSFSCLLLSIILILLTGCTVQRSDVPINYRWASVEGSQLQESGAGEQFYFNVPIDDGMIAESIPIKIKVSGNVTSGSLRFELRHPDGHAVWSSGIINPGDYSISTAYIIPDAQIGTYSLGLVYDANTLATYNLSWHAIRLGLFVLLPGIGMILVALAFVTYAVRQKILGWRYLGLGALLWILTVAVKIAFAIPVNPLVFQALGVPGNHLFSPGNLTAYLYIGALTGIFEAGLTWLILRKSHWGKAGWTQALVFGIGFGTIEALLLGLAGFGSALAGLLSPDILPVYTLASLANNATLGMGLAPIVERLSVILAHIFSCVLIFYAIASNETKWGWLAIIYKTLLDTPAGFAAFWGAGTIDKIWTLEIVIAVFGMAGISGILLVSRRYQNVTHNEYITSGWKN